MVADRGGEVEPVSARLRGKVDALSASFCPGVIAAGGREGQVGVGGVAAVFSRLRRGAF